MIEALAPEDVRSVYMDGVDAVVRISEGLSDDEWHAACCGSWSATQTARHLVGVAAWYHEWLDAAVGGTTNPPFTSADLPGRNEAALQQLSDRSGPEAIAEFQASARDYFERARASWNLAFGYPAGVVTVGLHAGIAAAEWHLHAWDIDPTDGHEPADATTLFVAAARCIAASQGGMRGRTLSWVVPLGARRKPWATMLRRSGR